MKRYDLDAHAQRDLLMKIGAQHDGRYPWHATRDPYEIFVAEYFLRRTTRTVVARIFPEVISRFPTVASLAVADPDDVLAVAREAGLFSRTRKIVTVATKIVEQGGIAPDRRTLLALPSVGPYLADALLLYAYRQRAFPLDGNIQRVVLRLSGLHALPRPAPYQDPQLEGEVGRLTAGLDASGLRSLHQGILCVAWETCRARPACTGCPLVEHCHYGRELRPLAGPD